MKKLGEFYREKILSLPRSSLKKIELPYNPSSLEIKGDLFGCKLYYTRFGRKTQNFIECRSEQEARYLKIFFEAGLSEVQIPKDDNYLNSILPDLVKLKTKTDNIINEFLESLTSRKIRDQVKYLVWSELTR
jgi:hypothetical protein